MDIDWFLRINKQTRAIIFLKGERQYLRENPFILSPSNPPLFYVLGDGEASSLFHIKIGQIPGFKSYWSCKNPNVLQCQANQVIPTNGNYTAD